MLELLFLLWLVVFLILLRNFSVYKARMQFLSPRELHLYEVLPVYKVMLLHPRYYHLWTPAQWRKFVEGNQSHD